MKIIDLKLGNGFRRMKAAVKTDAEMARILGVSRAHVGRILKGTTNYLEDETWTRIKDIIGRYIREDDPSNVEPAPAQIRRFPVISDAAAASCNTAFLPIADWADEYAEDRVSFSEGQVTIEKQILNALRKAITIAGGKPKLAKQLGVSHSIINRFENGTCSISNMQTGTLAKLFPDLKLFFFRQDWPQENASNFQGAHLTGVQMGHHNKMGHVNTQTVSNMSDAQDESTRMLMRFWGKMSLSRRFELLSKLAEQTEKK